MVEFSHFFGTGRVMLALGVVMLYISSRAGAHTLAGRECSPGRRALGNWFPIAAAAIVAICLRRGDWAVSIIYATSIGCLSLLLGSICMMSPNSATPPTFGRLWLFAFPAALLALLIGFAGDLKWYNAIFLLIEGGALLLVWRELASSNPPGIPEAEIADPTIRNPALHWVNVVLCILLAIIGAIACGIGATHISADYPDLPSMTPIIAILAPILILPMLTGSATLAHDNRAPEAVTSGIAIILLNLCLLLPAAAFLWYLGQIIGVHSISNLHLTLAAFQNASPLPFPWVTWRVDSVLLVVLSFALFPAALGRWTMGRAEGVTLIAVYGVYVLMETAASLHS